MSRCIKSIGNIWHADEHLEEAHCRMHLKYATALSSYTARRLVLVLSYRSCSMSCRKPGTYD